jgi:cytosine/adenosine deaminase-related metal-dependent hydrolase
MILNKVKIYGADQQVSIEVADGHIAAIYENSDPIPTGQVLELDHSTAIPGLINSHDHLDFNLYPQLGDHLFDNYHQWGKYTLEQYREEIGKVRQIPLPLRILWGIYKNLLCGVTTVVNHGEKIDAPGTLINVFQDSCSLHSVGFEKNWKYKLNKRSGEKLYVIHAGEGRDDCARKEIDTLIRWNVFKKKIIAVHGVAMTGSQAESFSALVWCPVSNYFMFNETARVDILKAHTRIVLGTDSTLTAGWNFWDHLRLAKDNSLFCDQELFSMVTDQAAAVWGLGKKGSLQKGFVADLVILKNAEGKDHIFERNPEDILLVMRGGEVKLFDECLLAPLQKEQIDVSSFSRISLKRRAKYVFGDLPGLIGEIKRHDPDIVMPVAIE